jgi:enoyl-CoA hydratase/carnithine racemase
MHGEVLVARMDAGENCLRPELLDELERLLELVERADGPGGLVLSGSGKVFSYGLDLVWMAGATAAAQDEVLRRVQAIFARLLSAPVPTTAAINGHAFGGGAMLALACDGRAMRSERGWFCLPEVDFGLPFTPGMSALIGARLAPQVALEAMTTGRRWGGADALAAGIVDLAVGGEPEALLSAAVERTAAAAGKPRALVQAIKRQLHRATLEALADAALDRALLPEQLRATPA